MLAILLSLPCKVQDRLSPSRGKSSCFPNILLFRGMPRSERMIVHLRIDGGRCIPIALGQQLRGSL